MSEQVREPMETPTPPSARFEPDSPPFWVIVVVLLALNIWYDYYHPLGLIFDVVLAVGLLIGYLGRSKPA